MSPIDFDTLQDLSNGAPVADAPCPLCSENCKTPSNRTRKVLRIWHQADGFATYKCQRCGEAGYVKPEGVTRSTPRPRPQTMKADPDKSPTARFLWSQKAPIAGSIAERYLREPRGYHGPLPATLGFLPPRAGHPPAMIAAFGIPDEPQPGYLVVNNDTITGVHLTKLRSDGSGKADVEANKIMLGRSVGQPIILASPNDLLGLAITEGIEDALAVHESTGLGAWAAGSAGRMPALADAIPQYVETVTVFVDNNQAGRENSHKLVSRLKRRGIEVRTCLLDFANEVGERAV